MVLTNVFLYSKNDKRMNINAQQSLSFDIAHMDMTTALSYFGQIVNILNAQTE